MTDGRRILIVDDDSDLVNIITQALQAYSFEVFSAPEPIAGLSKARELKPDLIILDYHMPGTNGAHLFESFRRNRGTAETPIIFMSGDAASQDIQAEIIADSRTRFLAKPARFEDLRNTIHELLAAA